MENRIKVEDEVKNRGGFRDESSKLYVVINGSYVFLFPEEEFDKLNSIDRKIVWDTVDYVLQNSLTNKEGDTEYTFDMFDLMKISHTVVLPPITLKVDISSDDDVSGDEFNTLYNDTPYHVHSMVMKKAGEYTVYVNRTVYDGLSEEDKDTICDNVGSIAWSGCDKHVWFIESNTDFMNFSNIIFVDIKPNYARRFVLDEIEEYGGFKDDKTDEYVIYQYPCTFIFPEWFENVDKSCRENIYYICHKISQDENRPSSNSTNSYTYKWDDIMSCMPIYYTPRKAYSGDALGQLIDRQNSDQNKRETLLFDTEENDYYVNLKSCVSRLQLHIKRDVWDKLFLFSSNNSYNLSKENIFNAFTNVIKTFSQNAENGYDWSLDTLDSVSFFIKAALDTPLTLRSNRVECNTYFEQTREGKIVLNVDTFNFDTGKIEACCFYIGTGDFFSVIDEATKSDIIVEAKRVACLSAKERCEEFNTFPIDCKVFYLGSERKFTPYKPEPIIDTQLPCMNTSLHSIQGRMNIYVTMNDEIVKENIYDDNYRGERCKILKFTSKHNGIYFFSISSEAWSMLDQTMEDMVVTKARIISKSGCSNQVWYLNSVTAVEEFINIPIVDEKNLLGLNNTNPNPNPIKEENTMFNKFPFKKNDNDNLPKKEANSPAMPTPEQAKVIMDAMCACQTDISQYAEDMRRDRARANATMARAILTHGILTDDSMIDRNFLLPKDVKYPYATRMLDGELVVVTNGKPASDQVLTTINSVPVTNLQDYANILGTLNLVKEQSADHGLTAEEAASIVTNYIGCRDQALLNMLQDTNSLEKVIGEKTVKEIENTEFSNLMITTSPTVMRYITIEPVDEDSKK
jgi:hypothetical protein